MTKKPRWGLYTVRPLIRKPKVYTTTGKKRNYETGERAEISRRPRRSRMLTERRLGQPPISNVTAGQPSLVDRPDRSHRNHLSGEILRFLDFARNDRARNIDIHRGTRAAAQTGRSRFQFPGTRRFCLRNCGSRFFRCRDTGRSRD